MNATQTLTRCTPQEMMQVAAARLLTDKDVCLVGIGAPSVACNLARLTHAPGIKLIYESGTIDTKPEICRRRFKSELRRNKSGKVYGGMHWRLTCVVGRRGCFSAFEPSPRVVGFPARVVLAKIG